ncbi:MAG: helix-turn-helix domain-containing protein [Candidatus Dormibacteria bacterium]
MTALLKLSEVADRLRQGRTKTYLMAERGELPCIRIGGAIRVSEDALTAWLEAHTTESQEVASR